VDDLFCCRILIPGDSILRCAVEKEICPSVCCSIHVFSLASLTAAQGPLCSTLRRHQYNTELEVARPAARADFRIPPAPSHLVIFGSDNTDLVDLLHILPHQASWRKPSLRVLHICLVPPCTAAAAPPRRTSRAARRKSSLQSPELSSGIGPPSPITTTPTPHSLHRKHRLFNPHSTVTLQPDR
jgi:hypothetical protein